MMSEREKQEWQVILADPVATALAAKIARLSSLNRFGPPSPALAEAIGELNARLEGTGVKIDVPGRGNTTAPAAAKPSEYAQLSAQLNAMEGELKLLREKAVSQPASNAHLEARVPVVGLSADDYLTAQMELAADEPAQRPPGFPAEVDGEPAFYRWKEIARTGSWIHPATKTPVLIDRARMDNWIENFQKYRRSGHLPFVPNYHVDARSEADRNHGFVIDMQREGDSLFGVFQIIGAESLNATRKNNVSIFVRPGAVDSATGERYDELLEHVALTPRPTLTGLKPFEKLKVA
jgi:hypothetical protein